MPGLQNVAPFQRKTVSFVRRESRLGPQQQRTWDEHNGTVIIDVPRSQAAMSVSPGFELDAVRHFGRVAPLVVEIGSGTGDALVHGALARPGMNFLAVEVYRTGLSATLNKIVQHNLTNVRLVRADAMQVLKHMLTPRSIEEVWVFFPDPWHKVKHHKRRLVTPAFAELVASRLAPGGTLRLATDWENYAIQMRDVLTSCASLTNRYRGPVTPARGPVIPARGTGQAPAEPGTGFAPRFPGRAMTRFETKGLESGRAIFDLELHRL